MKFFIFVTPLVGADPIADMNAAMVAAKAYLDEGQAEGWIESVYQFLDGRQAVAIADLDSFEAVWERLTAYPLFPIQQYEVHPVVHTDYVMARMVQNMAEMVPA